MNSTVKKIRVEGMKCEGCAKNVRCALEAVPNVAAVCRAPGRDNQISVFINSGAVRCTAVTNMNSSGGRDYGIICHAALGDEHAAVAVDRGIVRGAFVPDVHGFISGHHMLENSLTVFNDVL